VLKNWVLGCFRFLFPFKGDTHGCDKWSALSWDEVSVKTWLHLKKKKKKKKTMGVKVILPVHLELVTSSEIGDKHSQQNEGSLLPFGEPSPINFRRKK